MAYLPSLLQSRPTSSVYNAAIVRQRSALAVVALLGLQAAAQAKPRVGFANLAQKAEAGRKAIDEARAEAASAGHDLVAAGPVRAALERSLPPPPHDADDTLDEAIGRLAEAIDAYSDSHDADVLQHAHQVDKLLTGLLPTSDTVRTLAEANLLIGVVHADRKEDQKAIDSFRIVCRLQPDRAEIDADKYPPHALELYRRARRLEADRKGVTLRVTTIPSGTRVWVDGHLVGTSPIAAKNVAPGIHYVAVGHRDLEPHAGKVWVEPGAGSRIELQPQPLPAPERIIRIRREALAEPADEVSWREVARELAANVAVDVLVLVRDQPSGAIEAAFFDVSRLQLGAWVAMPSAAFTRALQPTSSGKLFANRMLDPRRGEARPWYRTWWGASLLVSGGIAVGGALVYAFSDRGAERDYSIGDWCFDGETCR